MDLKSCDIFVWILWKGGIREDQKISCGEFKSTDEDKLAFLKSTLPRLVDCSTPQPAQLKIRKIPEGQQLSLL